MSVEEPEAAGTGALARRGERDLAWLRHRTGKAKRRKSRGVAGGHVPAPRHLRRGRAASVLSRYLARRLVASTLAVAVFVMGLAFGAAATKYLNASQRDEIGGSLAQFVAGAKENDLGDPGPVIRGAVYENSVKTVGLFWLLGLSVVGAPLVLVLVFSKGFALGFSIGFLVESFAGKGLLLAIASILPHNLIMVPALLVGAIASLSAAFRLALRRFRDRTDDERRSAGQELLSFTALCAIAAVVLAVGAIVQGYLTPLLIAVVARAMG